MAAEKECQRLSDSLLNGKENPDLAGHIATCVDCQRLQQNIQRLNGLRSAFFPPASPASIRSIVDQVFPAPTFPWPLTLLTLTAALGILVFSLIAVSSISPSSATRPPSKVVPALPGQQIKPLPVAANPGLHPDTRRIIMAAGERLVTAPDGTQFELSGRVDLRILDRGFILQEGMIIAHVKPGKGPFIGKTPHGTIEVVGTVFKVMVKIDRTFVSVLDGRVKIRPLRGAPRNLSVAEGFEMSATPDGTATSTWACPPGQESHQR